MTCYSQINQGSWCQEWYETASRDAGRRARELRELGYRVVVEGLGEQVTRHGRVGMTLVDIRCGDGQTDTINLPVVSVCRG